MSRWDSLVEILATGEDGGEELPLRSFSGAIAFLLGLAWFALITFQVVGGVFRP